jgi:glycosyltransferase 2 family protein
MKLLSKIISIVVISILVYVSFLIISDITSISNESLIFQFEYLPIILIFITLAFFSLIYRWHLLLKKSEINIPNSNSILIFMAGVSLAIIPGKAGELIKSELLKTKFDVPRAKSVSIVVVEQVYSAIGLIIVSLFGMYYFDLGIYITISFSIIVISLFLFLSNEILFQKFSKIFLKIKFLNKFLGNISESQLVIKKLLSGKFVLSSILFSTLFWISICTAIYFIILAFGINTFEYFAIWTMYASSIMLGFISFLPLGIGVVEGSFAGFMAYEGIDISVALTLIIIIRLLVEWVPISAGFICLKISYGKKTINQDKDD